MSRQNRCDQIDESSVGVHHCINRCVRQAFLCGVDPVSGQNYDHRKGWIERRLEFLAGIFAVDVIGFSVMSKHFHLILRHGPHVVGQWPDSEVARRWWNLFPRRRQPDGSPAQPRKSELKELAGKIHSLRRRLSCITWLRKGSCFNLGVRRFIVAFTSFIFFSHILALHLPPNEPPNEKNAYS